jgi:hypothetical protein
VTKLLVDRFSSVRSAKVESRDLILVIVLYDTIAPPPMSEPVLELILHDCVDIGGLADNLGLFQRGPLREVEQEDTPGGKTLTFADDVEEWVQVECKSVTSMRREFAEAEWLGLVDSYERWVRRDIEKRRRLERTLGRVNVLLKQEKDRAHRILEQSGAHPRKEDQAAGKLKVIEQVENVIRSGLEESS